MLLTKQQSQARVALWTGRSFAGATLYTAIQFWRGTAVVHPPRSDPVPTHTTLLHQDKETGTAWGTSQIPTTGAKDQFGRRLWRPLEQALQRMKMMIGTPQPGCYSFILWSFFREAFHWSSLSRNWNNQIIKAVARLLLTKSEQHFAWSQEKAVISQLPGLQARIQKKD